MTRLGVLGSWFFRLIAVALAVAFAYLTYLALDLHVRQLRYSNCMEELRSIEMRRVTYGGGIERLDEWGQDRFQSVYWQCAICRGAVERWPRR